MADKIHQFADVHSTHSACQMNVRQVGWCQTLFFHLELDAQCTFRKLLELAAAVSTRDLHTSD